MGAEGEGDPGSTDAAVPGVVGLEPATRRPPADRTGLHGPPTHEQIPRQATPSTLYVSPLKYYVNQLLNISPDRPLFVQCLQVNSIMC